jgi:hypothetical protein
MGEAHSFVFFFVTFFFGRIFIVVIMLSCGKRKAPADNGAVKSDAVKEALVKKYNAVADWDSSDSYTSYFQKKFIEQKQLMLFQGRIYDIVKDDSVYIVKVMDERKDADHNFLALITFTSEELNEKLTDNKSTEGVFVIGVYNVTSSNPSVKEDEASDGDDHSYTYTHLSDDADHMLTVFRGKMIDCQFETVVDTK